MSEPGSVASRRVGRVAVVTIDNRRHANAIDDAVRASLSAALSECFGDADVRAVVLAGAGRTFCAGGDLASMPVADEPALRRRLGEMQRIVTILLNEPKPVVAAVEGAAFGSGLSLACTADFVVAAESARLGLTFGQVGLAPDVGLAWTLSRRLGVSRARQLCLRQAVLAAAEAHDLGLVDAVVPDGTALDAAVKLAASLGDGAPLAVGATRRIFAAADLPLPEFLALEADLQVGLWQSADFAEGRAAFYKKRQPEFVGA